MEKNVYIGFIRFTVTIFNIDTLKLTLFQKYSYQLNAYKLFHTDQIPTIIFQYKNIPSTLASLFHSKYSLIKSFTVFIAHISAVCWNKIVMRGKKMNLGEYIANHSGQYFSTKYFNSTLLGIFYRKSYDHLTALKDSCTSSEIKLYNQIKVFSLE